MLFNHPMRETVREEMDRKDEEKDGNKMTMGDTDSDSDSTSDSSEVSVEYQSDGEVMISSAQNDDSTEEEQDPDCAEAATGLPNFEICEEEYKSMMDILTSHSEEKQFLISPHSMNEFLVNEHPAIVNRLKELPDRPRAVAIASHCLRAVINRQTHYRRPSCVSSDVCVFSPRAPVAIFTFTSDQVKAADRVRHNTRLTRDILQLVRKESGLNFDAIYGTISESDSKSRDAFLSRFAILVHNAEIMSFSHTLQMDPDKCLVVMKSIFKSIQAFQTERDHSLPVKLHEDR